MLEDLEVFFSLILQVQCFMYVVELKREMDLLYIIQYRVSTFNLQLYCCPLESMPTLKMVTVMYFITILVKVIPSRAYRHNHAVVPNALGYHIYSNRVQAKKIITFMQFSGRGHHTLH